MADQNEIVIRFRAIVSKRYGYESLSPEMGYESRDVKSSKALDAFLVR